MDEAVVRIELESETIKRLKEKTKNESIGSLILRLVFESFDNKKENGV
jgi:hypothetical protein